MTTHVVLAMLVLSLVIVAEYFRSEARFWQRQAGYWLNEACRLQDKITIREHLPMGDEVEIRRLDRN